MALFPKTLISFLAGLAITMALLLIPAGTWHYSQAWLFMSLLFIPILIVGIALFGSLLQNTAAALGTLARHFNHNRLGMGTFGIRGTGQEAAELT